MRYILVFIVLLFIASCATSKPCVCPDEDIVIIDGQGMPTKIGKGWLIPENYYTIEEWKKLVQEYYNSLYPKQEM